MENKVLGSFLSDTVGNESDGGVSVSERIFGTEW